MALYAIGDLHLSLAVDKSMEIFGPAWENYAGGGGGGFSLSGPLPREEIPHQGQSRLLVDYRRQAPPVL